MNSSNLSHLPMSTAPTRRFNDLPAKYERLLRQTNPSMNEAAVEALATWWDSPLPYPVRDILECAVDLVATNSMENMHRKIEKGYEAIDLALLWVHAMPAGQSKADQLISVTFAADQFNKIRCAKYIELANRLGDSRLGDARVDNFPDPELWEQYEQLVKNMMGYTHMPYILKALDRMPALEQRILKATDEIKDEAARVQKRALLVFKIERARLDLNHRFDILAKNQIVTITKEDWVWRAPHVVKDQYHG